MPDADLLDLLEIIETFADAIYCANNSTPNSDDLYWRGKNMTSTFRTSIRQRMIASQGEV